MVQAEGVITSALPEAGAPLAADALIASLGEGEEAIDRLLEAVVAIKRQQRSLDDQLNALLDQLQQLHERGDVDASFHFNDTAFSWSPGRVQFTYPEPVLALEQQLKLARKTAEGNGTAVRRHGRPFWTVKLPSA
jgi:hypothetical protein